MSHALSETASYDATITVPDDGDDATAASADLPFGSLANRTKFLHDRLGSYRAALTPSAFQVSCADGATIAIAPVKTASGLDDSGLSSAITTALTVADLEGGGSFTASRFYYLYAFDAGSGNFGFQISGTAPDAWKLFKLGTFTHRYIGRFATDGSSVIVPFAARRGRYTFRAPHSVLASGSALAWADVNLAAFVPADALAIIRLTGTAVGASANLDVRTKGDTSGSFTRLAVPTGQVLVDRLTIETDASRVIQYQSSAAAGSLTIEVIGWQE